MWSCVLEICVSRWLSTNNETQFAQQILPFVHPGRRISTQCPLSLLLFPSLSLSHSHSSSKERALRERHAENFSILFFIFRWPQDATFTLEKIHNPIARPTKTMCWLVSCRWRLEEFYSKSSDELICFVLIFGDAVVAAKKNARTDEGCPLSPTRKVFSQNSKSIANGL